jgi:hypothetical protein
MSYLDSREGTRGEVHQTIGKSKSSTVFRWSSPLTWVLYGTVLGTSAVILYAWGALVDTTSFSPEAATQEAATQEAAPPLKTLKLSPYIPVIEI